MAEINVNDTTFEQEVLQSDLPVLVDFWAEWCVPCRMLGPVISQIAQEYKGKIKVVKLNIDEASRTAGQYGIQSIPTLVLFHKGETVSRQTGVLPKASIEQMFAAIT